MRTALVAVISALERLDDLLNKTLITRIRKDTPAYRRITREMDRLITEKLRYVDAIKEANQKLNARLERVAEERFRGTGCEGIRFGEPGFYDCVKRQPSVKHIAEAANREMGPTKQKLEETKQAYEDLKSRLPELLHLDLFIDTSEQLKRDAWTLAHELHIVETSGDELLPDQRAFLEQAKQALTSIEPLADLLKEEFSQIDQHLQPPETTGKQADEDAFANAQHLKDDINDALRALKKAHEDIKGKPLRQLTKIVDKQEQLAKKTQPSYAETTFHDFSTERYDTVLMDTSAIIDIYQAAKKQQQDFRKVMPPAWLQHKKLILMEPVIEEIARIIANDETHQRQLRQRGIAFTPRINALEWESFQKRWPHHIKKERVEKHSALVMAIYTYWKKTPKGKKAFNSFGNDWECKEYFESTADLAICLYSINNQENILILAWDEDIREVINAYMEGRSKQRTVGYLTTQGVRFTKKTTERALEPEEATVTEAA